MLVGIIGNGFVGQAIDNGMKIKNIETLVYDVDKDRSKNTFEEVVKQANIVFVCVPTPYNSQKQQFDASIIDKVLEQASQYSCKSDIIIKSTVIPGTCNRLQSLYPNMNIVFSPEFLTERTANDDFLNPSRIILGFNDFLAGKERISSFFKVCFPGVPVITTDYKTSEFTKYFCNCFYAAKVSLMNEFYELANALSVDWSTAVEGMLSSGWVNEMHTKVPGPDGDYGFGGKCFPKDIQSLIKLAKQNDVDPVLLESAWKKNLQIRKNKNWLQIDGAIT
tara:strand:+ start:2344 stop:3177 length:834 start_codon:yes stop_codon:yes gene_type:complete